MIKSVQAIIVFGALSQIPQIESNSTQAKSMRCALAEGILSEQLSKHIFVDCYLHEEFAGAEPDNLARIFNRLNHYNASEAGVVRCQLAKVYGDISRTDRIPVQAQRAADAAFTILKPWFKDNQSNRNEFIQELTALFAEAMQTWSHVQRSGMSFRVLLEAKDNCWYDERTKRHQYDSLAEAGFQLSSQRALQATYPVATLFPQIQMNNRILFHGYALFSTQANYVIATEDRNRQLQQNIPSMGHRRGAGEDGHRQLKSEQYAIKNTRRLSNPSIDGIGDKSSLVTSSESSSSVRANSQSRREGKERSASVLPKTRKMLLS
jgi:hypothetical protein